jgi:hypothetical protein
MRSNFDYNTQQAKIQGLSVQVGELFADMYRDNGPNARGTWQALEAYKYLRRLLPRENNGYSYRHIGATAAHNATQRMN